MWRQGREGTHAATCQDHLEPLLPEAGRTLPRSLQREHGPVSSLTSDLWSQNCKRTDFCSFQPPSL